MVGIIYKYISPSGKIYIGQTTNEHRRRKTFFNVNKKYGGDKIDNARKKHRPENFHYEVLYKEVFSSEKDAQKKLDELEEYYIRLYESYESGYNMTYGGYTNIGFRYSDEQKKKMSLYRIGKKLRARTSKERQRHSEIMKEKWNTPEYRTIRENINNSEDHKQKLSVSLGGSNNGMYGKSHTPESRIKMSNSRFGVNNIWYGKIKSKEYRDKISGGMIEYYKNNSVSNETKNKISNSISTPVNQYSINGNFIKTHRSSSLAGDSLGIDPSCIIKVCKGKRKTAGGFIWKYAETQEYTISWDQAKGSKDWLGIADIVNATGRNRNVIYYHVKKHGVPIIVNGRQRLIYMPALNKILK